MFLDDLSQYKPSSLIAKDEKNEWDQMFILFFLDTQDEVEHGLFNWQ